MTRLEPPKCYNGFKTRVHKPASKRMNYTEIQSVAITALRSLVNSIYLSRINTLDMWLNCPQLTLLPSLDLLVPTNLNWSCFTTSAVFK